MEHDNDLLQIIKDDLAIEVGWKSFRHMVENVNIVPRDVATIAKRYAEAMYKKESTRSLEREKVLVEALEQLISRFPENPISTWDKKAVLVAKAALASYRGEKQPPQEIEYMPIHPGDAKKPGCPQQFPMHLLKEIQAYRNHGQTLQRLKERGGLGVLEILAIVNDKPWSYYRDLKWPEALRMLNEALANYEGKKEVGNG